MAVLTGGRLDANGGNLVANGSWYESKQGSSVRWCAGGVKEASPSEGEVPCKMFMSNPKPSKLPTEKSLNHESVMLLRGVAYPDELQSNGGRLLSRSAVLVIKVDSELDGQYPTSYCDGLLHIYKSLIGFDAVRWLLIELPQWLSQRSYFHVSPLLS